LLYTGESIHLFEHEQAVERL